MLFPSVKGRFARTADVSTSFPSGERLVCPDGRRLNIVSSGERLVCPDGRRLNIVSSGERLVCPDETL